MLDFSLIELLLIIAIAILVIGPKELPAIMRSFGRLVRRMQYVKFALSRQFDDFMRESELEELRKSGQSSGEDYNEADADEAYFTDVNFEQSRHEKHQAPVKPEKGEGTDD